MTNNVKSHRRMRTPTTRSEFIVTQIMHAALYFTFIVWSILVG